MWQEKQAEKLRFEIEALLAPLSDVTGLYDLIKEPLTKSRRGLAGEVEHLRLWPLLPLDSILTEISELIQDSTQIRNLLLRCGAIHMH